MQDRNRAIRKSRKAGCPLLGYEDLATLTDSSVFYLFHTSISHLSPTHNFNNRFEINKRKEYQNGLSAAFSEPFPDDFKSDIEELMSDKEVSAAIKETLRLWREIAAPFSNTLSYIVNNRFILEALPEIIDDDSCDHVTMLAEDVFDLLQRLNKSTTKAFIATVKGKTGCVESLYAALLEGDKKAFVHLLRDHHSDAKPLIRRRTKAVRQHLGAARCPAFAEGFGALYPLRCRL